MLLRVHLGLTERDKPAETIIGHLVITCGNLGLVIKVDPLIFFSHVLNLRLS